MEGGHNAAVLLRGFTYSAIGQLARRMPSLFLTDAPVPRTLFNALSQEAPEVRVSVQEALSMACAAYKGVYITSCVSMNMHVHAFTTPTRYLSVVILT